MRLFGFDKIHAKILVNMAAEPNAEVYVRAWNDNSAWRLGLLLYHDVHTGLTLCLYKAYFVANFKNLLVHNHWA